MGFSKVVDKGNGKVIFVHQLGGDGKAYAEDVTVEVQEGVPADRVEWWAKQNGKIGVVTVSFSSYMDNITNPETILFPEV